jgi:hypothetical protein
MALLKQLENHCRVHRESMLSTGISTAQCMFPASFVPNPGAQAEVFRFISLDPLQPNALAQTVLYYRGGINSGKSYAGAGFICANALRDRDARQLITANSYGQLETSTLVALAEFCKRYAIPLAPVAGIEMESPEWADLTAKKIANARFCTVFGAPVLVLSADAFTGRTDSSTQPGRGLQIRGFWADEFAYADRSAFQTMMGRLNRGPGTMKGVGIVTSSININNPYNWIYELFDDPERDESKQKYYLSIGGSSSENIHADPDFIEQQASSLTAEMALIELGGQYAVASTKRTYHCFDRTLNQTDIIDSPQDVLHIGMDFNIDKMAAVVHVVRYGLPVAVGEFYGLKDTPAMLRAIAERHPERTIQIYPDASGQYARSTVDAGRSDIALIKQAGYRVVVNPTNPVVRDRMNAMNAMFLNARGERRYRVNVKQCPVYVRCLEQQLNGDDGLPIKPKEDNVSHILDAGGYFIVKRYPVQGLGVTRGPRMY